MIPRIHNNRLIPSQAIASTAPSNAQSRATERLTKGLRELAADLREAADEGDAAGIADVLSEVTASLNPQDLHALPVETLREYEQVLTTLVHKGVDAWLSALHRNAATANVDVTGLADIIGELKSLSTEWARAARSDAFLPSVILTPEFAMNLGERLGEIRARAASTGHTVANPMFQAPLAPTANPTFSATLIPSTPADRMPPA